MLCKLSLEEPYILNRVISVTVFLWSGTIAGFFILNEYTIHSIEVLAMVHSLIWFLGLLGIVFGLNHIGQSKRKLLEGKDRLEIMFKSMHNGLLLIHAHTHIIKDANPAACRLINAPREEIVGQLCHQFICPAEIGACPITDLFQTMENSESVLIDRKSVV